jgi:diguanylate cyclase (GGDEF)-like protein
MMNSKSFFLYYAFVFIVFIGLVNTAAFIQFKKVLQIEFEVYMFIVPTVIGTILSVLFMLAIYFYKRYKMMGIYESVAKKDTLTGATSRYACELILDMENKRNLRNHTPFSILMIDVDDFKQINDKYGHLIGDQVLRSLVVCIEMYLRDMDVVCRWGGEEFIVILPDTNDTEAKMVANILRESIGSFDFEIVDQVTVSIGISTMYETHHNIESMIKKSDDALYKAKNLGKNRVIVDANVSGNGAVV